MDFTLEQFVPLVNSNFTLQTQAGPFELTLSDAAELPRGNRPAGFRTPLSLLFTGPMHLDFNQDMYIFNHPVMGQHTWHMVQVMAPLEPPSSTPKSEPMRYYEVLFG
jgi:hypothetical protein